METTLIYAGALIYKIFNLITLQIFSKYCCIINKKKEDEKRAIQPVVHVESQSYRLPLKSAA